MMRLPRLHWVDHLQNMDHTTMVNRVFKEKIRGRRPVKNQGNEGRTQSKSEKAVIEPIELVAIVEGNYGSKRAESLQQKRGRGLGPQLGTRGSFWHQVSLL